jgi:glycogen operon protein
LRGTYAGVAHPAIIAHLQLLGVTTLELLPIQYFVDEPHLQKMGFPNYWGYNSIAWLAPEPRYWSAREGTTPLSEIKEMVKALHAAGIEVILDVVFNHSGEGSALGPTLSLRGIDNAVYYALHSGGDCENWTGCGNALNFAHPRVVQLVMDSLRYWVSECHIDGFRFDLAVTLGRSGMGFNQCAAMFAALQQDPLLAQCKLIVEPWDIGPHGYQLGNFPPGWGEWNDQFRDVMRGFWLKDGVIRSVFARRFAASADYFRKLGRSPATSINFLTAHDGFTLADLVSYNHKHNMANGEHNRDGHGHNQSWNCGEEGPSLDANVNLLRRQVRKALMASLLLAHGTPMLLAGDELGHTQQGNNNAYCQDNELTWLDWVGADQEMVAFVGKLMAIRKEIAALTSDCWWTGQPDVANAIDVAWLNPAGSVMTLHDWDDRASKALMIRFNHNWLLLINGSGHQVNFNLPQGNWRLRLSTADDLLSPGSLLVSSPRSVAVLEESSEKVQEAGSILRRLPGMAWLDRT